MLGVRAQGGKGKDGGRGGGAEGGALEEEELREGGVGGKGEMAVHRSERSRSGHAMKVTVNKG
jgi:hypothetical protein